MEKNIDLDMDNEIIDKDMEKLLAILHHIPEVEIPARFEQRLNDALKKEGSRIREERLFRTAKKKHSRYLKAAAAAAACFVVVFASLSMYNEGIGLFSDHNASEESASDETMLSAGKFDAATGKTAPSEAPVADSKETVESEDMGLAADQRVMMMNSSTPTPASEEPRSGSYDNGRDSGNAEIYYGIQNTEPDPLCRKGSKYIEATEEYLAYRKLVDEYLSGYEFELTGCDRDSVTGGYLFNILVLADPEGQIVNAPLILIGEQGEIHEQQAEQQSTDGEPIEKRPTEENDIGGE